eukprot:5152965-Pleurochrysis_carterae.AAC.2
MGAQTHGRAYGCARAQTRARMRRQVRLHAQCRGAGMHFCVFLHEPVLGGRVRHAELSCVRRKEGALLLRARAKGWGGSCWFRTKTERLDMLLALLLPQFLDLQGRRIKLQIWDTAGQVWPAAGSPRALACTVAPFHCATERTCAFF